MPTVGTVVAYLDVRHLLAAATHALGSLVEFEKLRRRRWALKVEGRPGAQLLKARSARADAAGQTNRANESEEAAPHGLRSGRSP